MQYLIEAETKRDALQVRMDACAPDHPPKSWVRDWSDLEDYIARLRAELGIS